MNFTDLYKRVIINEQNKEVADPQDFDDVEPLPVTEPIELATDTAEQPAAEQPATAHSSSLTDYIVQIEDFANKLNGTDGSSLQSLVSQLDKVESPYEGIYSRTSAEIVDAAKTLRSVSEKLKNFIIHAAKNN